MMADGDMDNNSNQTAEYKEKTNWNSWISVAIAFAALIFGGGYFYNEVWNAEIISYRILPPYEVAGTVFNGIVVQNDGRQAVTDLLILSADLPTVIDAIDTPGVHEPAMINDGGVGQSFFNITMPRLSSGSSISVFMIAEEDLLLDKHIIVTSNEVVGKEAKDVSIAQYNRLLRFSYGYLGFILIVGLIMLFWPSTKHRGRR